MHRILPRRRCSAGPDAGGAAPGTVLDATALARLRELDPDNSRGFLRQLLQTYEASMVRHLGRLGALDAVADAKAAGEIAHTLKSSSASVGALAFSACCAQLERCAKNGEMGDIVPALKAVLAEGERVLEAVRAMLQN